MTNLYRKLFDVTRILFIIIVIIGFTIRLFLPSTYVWTNHKATLELEVSTEYQIEFTKSLLPNWDDRNKDKLLEIYLFRSYADNLSSFELILEPKVSDDSIWDEDAIFDLVNPGEFDFRRDEFTKILTIPEKNIIIYQMLISHPEYENFSNDLFFLEVKYGKPRPCNLPYINGSQISNCTHTNKISNIYVDENYKLEGSIYN